MASLPNESTSLSTSIIKADRSGRSRYSQDYREEVLAAFDKSSLSGMDFARQCDIKYPTFAGFKPGATTTISANSSNTSNSNAAFFPKANWEKR